MSVDQRPIDVLIVDDNHVVRMGITMLLDGLDDIRVVGEASNGQECVDAIDTLLPDVVMMTYSDDQAVIKGALEAGAKGYLVHGDSTADDITSAIRTVACGRTYLNGRAGEVLVSMLSGATDLSDNGVTGTNHESWGLTVREVEIMYLMAGGRNNTDIAKELFISPSTLKNHITRIFDKLGVRSRSEAIVLWLKGADSQDE